MHQLRFIFTEIKQPGKNTFKLINSHQAARQINVFSKQLDGLWIIKAKNHTLFGFCYKMEQLFC